MIGKVIGINPKHADLCLNFALQYPHSFYFEEKSWFDENLLGLDYLKMIQKSWDSTLNLEKVVNYWGLQPFIDMSIRSYSLSLKHQLMLAMYQLSDANCMIFNQIVIGLDVVYQQKFYECIQSYKERGKLVIVCCHHLDRLTPLCDSEITR